jgi:hypothetical protein
MFLDVIAATFGRAGILRSTLQSLCGERDKFNASSGGTAELGSLSPLRERISTPVE